MDDAPVGMQEGKNAGCWAVGLSASGNGVGLGREAFLALSDEDRAQRVSESERQLRAAGADYVIEDVSQLMSVVHDIAKRIACA